MMLAGREKGRHGAANVKRSAFITLIISDNEVSAASTKPIERNFAPMIFPPESGMVR